MMIKQGELFCGTSPTFIKEFMKITIRASYPEGAYLFHLGDPAHFSYILIAGHVRLSLGETGQTVYSVQHAGEMLGWSSLIGRDSYSASAICMAPAELLKIDKGSLQALLEKDTDNAVVFYKGLARELGNRLLGCYRIISTDL